MGFRLGAIIFLMVTLAMVAESSSSSRSPLGTLRSFGNMKVGDVIDQAEEMIMDSEASRRVLGGRTYISYTAMQKNNVPCSQRGQSYYNCNTRSKANPYTRGCSEITRCARRR